MKKLRFALATILAGSLAAHAISVTNGNVYTRGSGANYPDPLSGITYAGGNAYYSVADNGADVWGLYPCTIQCGRPVADHPRRHEEQPQQLRVRVAHNQR